MSDCHQQPKHPVMLDPHECADRRRKYGHADQQPPCHCSRGMGPSSGGEQQNSGDHKDDLGRRADRNVDHHTGRRLRPRHAALLRELRADEVAAHASDRQQRADRFADPSHPNEAEDAGAV